MRRQLPMNWCQNCHDIYDNSMTILACVTDEKGELCVSIFSLKTKGCVRVFTYGQRNRKINLTLSS